MATHQTHSNHDHTHGAGCGHTAVRHDDHVDFLHAGHLHRPDQSGVLECSVNVDKNNPADCTPDHGCGAHDTTHVHGTGCGHEAVPHGDHVDFLVAGHLHHAHGTHCDDHGALPAA